MAGRKDWISIALIMTGITVLKTVDSLLDAQIVKIAESVDTVIGMAKLFLSQQLAKDLA